MNTEQETHFVNLNHSYHRVANQSIVNHDLLFPNLKVSRDLFTQNSIIERKPVPKDFDVYALLSGLSFESHFTEKLVEVQDTISNIIGDTLHYWVKPNNFGVEYCVFKWPWEDFNESWMPLIRSELSVLKASAFHYSIKGIQLNPDGCLIAKGFDERAQIFSIRKQIKDALPFLPSKQSAWAHIPIGRILEPLGESNFSELMRYINNIKNYSIAAQKINSLKLIHESRWYMEKHEVLEEYIIA